MGDSSQTGTVDGQSVRTLGPDVAGEPGRAEHPSSIGRFRILRVLGAGGMGFVYVGRDEQLRRDVAIKVLRSERDSERARQRLEREAHALAQLSHPNVVPVFEVGEHEGRSFIAMELVEGDNLRAWLRRRARTWREIVDVFVQAARGLAAAHARGLVHRDFKPENALVRDDGEGTPERVRVVDFGVVAEADAPTTSEPAVAVEWGEDELQTRTGEFLGTPRYMAPEQFTGVGVGPAADQFAWCVALYEALASARPFLGASASELATAVTTTNAEPLPPGQYPRAIAGVLARGLARDPSERYASMTELIAAVQAAIAPRTRRWPWIAGGVVIAAAAVVVIVANRPQSGDPTAVEPVVTETVVTEAVASPASPAVELRGPASDMQSRAREPFARGHAALARGEPEVAVRSFDEAALPFERAQADGEDMAQIQLDRGLAYLALWKRSGDVDDLLVAYELLRRTTANEYRHPDPVPLQQVADAALEEIDRASLTDARGSSDLDRRFYLFMATEYPPGALVETRERVLCIAPCTIPLPVNEPTVLRFSREGFLDALMVARPLHRLVGMLPQQSLLRVPEGETYVPRTFEFPM